MSIYNINLLEVKNFKRVIFARLILSPGVQKIYGENGSGKTSLTDAILWLLRGASPALDRALAVERPIHEGARKAEVSATLADHTGTERFRCELKITDRGTHLTVFPVENGQLCAPIAKPRSLLDEFLGFLGGVDLWDFVRMGEKERRELLLRLVNPQDAEILSALRELDIFCSDQTGNVSEIIAALNAAYEETFQYRRQVNREITRLKGVVDSIHLPAGWKNLTPVETGEIADELAQEQKEIGHLRNLLQAGETWKRTTREMLDIASSVSSFSWAGQERVREWLEEMTQSIAQIGEIISEKEKKIADLQTRLKEADRVNALAADARRRLDAEKALADYEAESAELTARLVKIENVKRKLIANVKFPLLPELSVSENGDIHWKGFPISQASDAEKTLIGLALVAASPGKIRFVRFTGGLWNTLDARNQKRAIELIEKAKIQAVIEIPGKPTEPGDNFLVIENGVLEQPPRKEA